MALCSCRDVCGFYRGFFCLLSSLYRIAHLLVLLFLLWTMSGSCHGEVALHVLWLFPLSPMARGPWRWVRVVVVYCGEIILVIKCEDVSGNFLPGPWCGLMKDKWFMITLKWHTDVAFLDVVSDFGIHAWPVYCLVYSAKTALRPDLGVVLLLLDLLSQGLWYDASLAL